nr:hypothetical protein [Bradyrhizobium ivorense]
MKYSVELVQTMRDALEAVMAKVPRDQVVFGLKAAVAEHILLAAAHGHRTTGLWHQRRIRCRALSRCWGEGARVINGHHGKHRSRP